MVLDYDGSDVQIITWAVDIYSLLKKVYVTEQEVSYLQLSDGGINSSIWLLFVLFIITCEFESGHFHFRLKSQRVMQRDSDKFSCISHQLYEEIPKAIDVEN
jgi:hypothetical protein